MQSPSTSPTRLRHPVQPSIPGFRPAPKPNQRPVEELTLRELQDRYSMNKKLLASPGASTSTYLHRVLLEQAAIEGRLVELQGVESINSSLRRATIRGDGDMQVDVPPEPRTSSTLEAKRRAVSRFNAAHDRNGENGSFSTKEAMHLEQEAVRLDKERQQRVEEKKRRLGMPINGEQLTMQEREARIYAFMNYKPTESDLEDDSDEDDEDDDPASWFEDDQDDGRKGQDIVEPDYEDFSEIIRVDESKYSYGTFYDQQEDGD